MTSNNIIPSAFDDEPLQQVTQDAPFDTTDEASIKAATKEAKERDQKRRVAISEMLKVREVREVFGEVIFEWCHIEQPSISDQIVRMGFLEGERNIGQRLRAELQAANPEGYLLMVKEYGEKSND